MSAGGDALDQATGAEGFQIGGGGRWRAAQLADDLGPDQATALAQEVDDGLPPAARLW